LIRHGNISFFFASGFSLKTMELPRTAHRWLGAI
jgi:hypothetical protein